MDSNLLAELIQIKWILLALFIAVFLAILFFVVTIAYRVKAGNTESLMLMRDNSLAELALLDIKGDYEELLKKSNEMLESFPNDMLAHWYTAIGNQKIGQLGAALSALGRVKSINSGWNSEMIDEMIADVKSEMSGPRANDS